VGPLNIRDDFYPHVAVFNYGVLYLLRVERLLVSRIAKLLLINIYYS
jgi:hypothetical protein